MFETKQRRHPALDVLLGAALLTCLAAQRTQAQQPVQATPPTEATSTVLPPESAIPVLGRRVRNEEGADMGRLVDILIDRDARPVAAVVDIGGFLGLGNRRVAIAWSALRLDPANRAEPLIAAFTPEQVRSAPEYRDPTRPASVVTPAEPPK
jgi:PRC-barrel domain